MKLVNNNNLSPRLPIKTSAYFQICTPIYIYTNRTSEDMLIFYVCLADSRFSLSHKAFKAFLITTVTSALLSLSGWYKYVVFYCVSSRHFAWGFHCIFMYSWNEKCLEMIPAESLWGDWRGLVLVVLSWRPTLHPSGWLLKTLALQIQIYFRSTLTRIDIISVHIYTQLHWSNFVKKKEKDTQAYNTIQKALNIFTT